MNKKLNQSRHAVYNKQETEYAQNSILWHKHASDRTASTRKHM